MTTGRLKGSLPYVVPLGALVVLAWSIAATPRGWLLFIPIAALVGGVLSAVSHAEVIAHRVGEPLGAVVLALSVTVIEASLILALMLTHHGDTQSIARDTVFASFMIVVNGVIGLSILVAARRSSVVTFRRAGTSALLATLLTMASLTLVLPTFTTETPGPTFTTAQLLFAAATCLALYAFFIFFQTVHRPEDFTAQVLPEAPEGRTDLLAWRPTARQSFRSGLLLAASLVAVVGIAESLSVPLEDSIHAHGAPEAVVGLVIALLVLLPESVTAIRAARRSELQTSVNLSLGSAIASIGLTIPAIAILSVIVHQPIVLGLDPNTMVLFAITAVMAAITLAAGEVTMLQGAIHLVLFATFVFLAFNP